MIGHAAFDPIARHYGRLWDHTDVGRLQRDAVWRCIRPHFRPGTTILDLGCGAGDDALLFAGLGVTVRGIDASSEMVRIARERGVDAHVCRIEDAGSLETVFDGAISDFGALNCIADLTALREPLAASIAPGGSLAICLMTRFCVWETVWYLLTGEINKAVRRWNGAAESSIGIRIFYPTLRQIERAFNPAFRLLQTSGIGVLVPPSFVPALPARWLRVLDRIDSRIAAWPLFRSMGDHRVLVFRRS